jgi:hypothetical protein
MQFHSVQDTPLKRPLEETQATLNGKVDPEGGAELEYLFEWGTGSEGKLTFALSLSAKGKAALRRHRRLTLTVKITLTPLHGAAVTVTRGVVVHA